MITASDVKQIIIRDFENCMKSLTDISYDPSNNASVVIEDSVQFHCYDDIVQKVYQAEKGNGKAKEESYEDNPGSPDMILFEKDSVAFVEFKNGKINDRVRDNIKVKAIEGGIIILSKIISKYIKDVTFLDTVQLKKTYFLVYNKTKNPVPKDSRERIHNHSSTNRVRFGLDIYKGSFFYEVGTFTGKGFLFWLKRKGFLS